MTSTGNGYFCTRGTAEWEDTSEIHYPGTYAHRCYNRETTIMGGSPVHNEDLVNLPNWLVLKLRIDGEDAIRLSNVEVLSYRHVYDIRTATVIREMRFRDRNSRETSLVSRRFVSMAHSHQGALEWALTPENWSGRIEIVSAIDGRVSNRAVARYRDLEGRHLDPVTPRTFAPDTIALKVQIRQSDIYIAQAARTRVFFGSDTEPTDVERDLYQMEDYIQQVLAFDVTEGSTVRSRRSCRCSPHVMMRSPSRSRPPADMCCVTRISPRHISSTPRRGKSCGTSAISAFPGSPGRSCCCACTSRMFSRCVRVTRRAWMRGFRLADSTARLIADMSSGTSCTCIPSWI